MNALLLANHTEGDTELNVIGRRLQTEMIACVTNDNA